MDLGHVKDHVLYPLQRGSLGPPYGLLQGSMASLDGNLPREGNIVARSEGLA